MTAKKYEKQQLNYRTLGDTWRASLAARDSAGPQNNFDVIRLCAASLVIFSHSFEIVAGSRASEPLWLLTGEQATLGEMGVMIFFGLSGFLIAESWRRKPRLARFFNNRALRIMPALVALVAILAFVIGPMLTSYPLAEYYADSRFSLFLLNSVFIADFQVLPGVFGGAPVAAPLWTLFFEVACYVVLASLAAAGFLKSRICLGLIGICFLVSAFVPDGDGLFFYVSRFAIMAPWFFAGVYAALNKDRIRLDWRLAALAALILILTGAAGGFDQAFALCGIYLVLYLGLVRPPFTLAIRPPGDYSYGLYIWGWPVQQLVQIMLAPQSPFVHFSLAYPAAFALAVLSWRLVEAPALRCKSLKLGQLNFRKT